MRGPNPQTHSETECLKLCVPSFGVFSLKPHGDRQRVTSHGGLLALPLGPGPAHAGAKPLSTGCAAWGWCEQASGTLVASESGRVLGPKSRAPQCVRRAGRAPRGAEAWT